MGIITKCSISVQNVNVVQVKSAELHQVKVVIDVAYGQEIFLRCSMKEAFSGKTKSPIEGPTKTILKIILRVSAITCDCS